MPNMFPEIVMCGRRVAMCHGLGHEAILKAMQERLDRDPEIMLVTSTLTNNGASLCFVVSMEIPMV